ncbi:tRNA pseudouridine(55) synthase TruB [Parenemella sanctibonifatiensis]|uniref:tRNA pseudouridine synthase B n=1 Tax=Parenemella sanctibonifatiensis TaxID=2016505 RepID=A0A255E9P8_9ACTN|nr:tRNA pseudouridine(55) synthase TruB [Parenemella sanctibonifatiensis]OYN88236.1 tRNA pseudouridine(55) synthase TruB [Parenemella sanctibonifatiensis]OYN89930.1 tRNA pseudouridine(55) synthase TruB [Parenemella sanctibonifatiensis]
MPVAEALAGVVVIDKPAGLTSHQVVARLRRVLGLRKIGHAGTLDPMATGVLVCGIGRGTRLLGHLSGHDKGYAATIRFGITTSTDDAEGEIVQTPGAAGITGDDVVALLPRYRGDIHQIPSSVSAIKVNGKRAYALAREGEDVKLKARAVHIGRFELLEVRTADQDGVAVLDCDVQVDCSAGTYIRALARDLGADLGSGGHLTALRRIRSGPFTLDDAVALPEVDDQAPALLGLAEVAARCFPVVDLTEEQLSWVQHGRAVPSLSLTGISALCHDGELVALYEPAEEAAVAVAVFAG